MAGEKRTKPCGNCKKAKLKCEYGGSLPCNRCLAVGQAASCQFVVRLPSIGLPPVEAPGVYKPTQTPVYEAPAAPGQLKKLYPKNVQKLPLPFETKDKEDWKLAMEDKLESMDTKFNDLLMVLKTNQQALMDERELSRKYMSHNQALYEALQHQEKVNDASHFSRIEGSRKRESLEIHTSRKSMRAGDFRDSVLSLQEAKLLFKFFDTNISQQLFGFEIKQFSVDAIWESSPLLICAVCTIALMHYPDPRISGKQETLHRHLRELCRGLLFQAKPRTEQEGFNTIVALVLCSFWLSDSQMFTGLALQLANDFRITHPQKERKNALSDKDRLRLWYLLYILDGQQSMTFNRQALVSGDDYNVINSKKILLEAEDASEEPPRPSFTDLRLVSQVEYNAALNESLKGNAWELVAPAEFGIPSRSNLELDKWMVSWTVLLAPFNNGSVWLSKSTLIYYNFAKMYINSAAIRKIRGSSDGKSIILPNWKNCEVSDRPVPEKQGLSPDQDSDDSDDEEEAQDQEQMNVNVAVSAAQTVLNLVLNDKDILNNLKYVPVHIHIMLYYAAILLVSLPLDKHSSFGRARDTIAKLRTVKILLKTITSNLPTDRVFGHRLLDNLDQLFDERAQKLKAEIGHLETLKRDELKKELSDVESAYTAIELRPDSQESSSQEASPKPEKIYAWPGSHHGHP